MAIEILVPIGIFVLGMIISDITSSTGVRLVEENNKAAGR
jgi:hypothetical protein